MGSSSDSLFFVLFGSLFGFLSLTSLAYFIASSYMIENQKETPQEKPKSTPRSWDGSTNERGSFDSFTTFASTLSKTPASYVSSSLTTRVSLLSLSDNSTFDMVKNTNVDYATGSFCSSCSIPPHKARGLWCDGDGFAICATTTTTVGGGD